MTYQWQEHDGIISVLIDGKLVEPFQYIVAKSPPPWTVGDLYGQHQDFDTEDAAKLALILKLTNPHEL